jgi:hypothetical protein
MDINKKPNNKDPHNLYSSPNIVKSNKIKEDEISWKQKKHAFLLVRFKRRDQLDILTRQEANIEIYFTEISCGKVNYFKRFSLGLNNRVSK